MRIDKQEMVDITCEPEDRVELQVREDDKVIWININGICVVRVCRISDLVKVT